MKMMAVISGGSLIYTVQYDNFITYIIFNPYIKQGCHYSFRDHQTETQFKLLSPNHRICEQHGWDLSLCLSKYWYFQFYWKLFFPSRVYSQLFEIKLFFFHEYIFVMRYSCSHFLGKFHLVLLNSSELVLSLNMFLISKIFSKWNVPFSSQIDKACLQNASQIWLYSRYTTWLFRKLCILNVKYL